MQNGVNIDVSVDRGVDILRNDVDAILEQIINSNFIKNARHLTLPPGQYPRTIATVLNTMGSASADPYFRCYCVADWRKT